jgi:uncharacterized Tic20 family protein
MSNEHEIDRNIRFTAMWCSLINLVLPVSEIIFLTIINTIIINIFQRSNRILGIIHPDLNILLSLFPLLNLFLCAVIFMVWKSDSCNHKFVNLSMKKALNFTVSICLCLTILDSIWVRSLYVHLDNFYGGPSPVENSAEDTFTFCTYAIFTLCLIHFCAIAFGSFQAARGNIYKYPLSISFFR